MMTVTSLPAWRGTELHELLVDHDPAVGWTRRRAAIDPAGSGRPGERSRPSRARSGRCTGNGHEPAARRPAAPAQPGAPGLVRLLPARRVQPRLRLPELLHVAAGRQLAAAQAPPGHMEGHPPPLLRGQMVACLGGKEAVQPGEGGHHALPLPGSSHPVSLAGHGMPRCRP
jgi:hypothetical protein